MESDYIGKITKMKPESMDEKGNVTYFVKDESENALTHLEFKRLYRSINCRADIPEWANNLLLCINLEIKLWLLR
jgi:hypothetical protein